jgi:predicted aldo/keto reductase-like oxidoreductase
MRYRKFGKLNWEASILGFGAMRLPVINGEDNKIDEPEAIRMIRFAIDHGVNYLDTAWAYHGGKSEVTVGKALKNGYREKIKIATKLPPWEVKSVQDFDRILNAQLERLQTEKIDFYLLHSLNKTEWPKLRDLGVLRWAEGAMADGRITHLGFSFHGDYQTFQDIINYYNNWTVCQIQYNYMDEKFQAGTAGLEYAHKKGLAVIAMEPVRGGQLTKLPESIDRLWRDAPVQRTPQEWALLWVWDHPEVTLTLSGMSRLEHVIENIAIAEYAKPNSLKINEQNLIKQVRDIYSSLTPISCTSCQYCVPCPNGVDIPGVFNLYK